MPTLKKTGAPGASTMRASLRSYTELVLMTSSTVGAQAAFYSRGSSSSTACRAAEQTAYYALSRSSSTASRTTGTASE